MKRIVAILLTLLVAVALIFLTGCAEVVSQTSEPVKAELTGTGYSPASTYTTYNPALKMPQVQTRPADYDLYFMYGGQQYSLDVSSGVYHAYEGRTGKEFDMVLITKVYDNDTVKRELVFPEEAQ